MRGVLVAIDLETTGLDVSDSRIMEIGAVKFRAGDTCEIIERFQTLIDPGMVVPDRVSALTGIRQEDLAGAPQIAEVLPRLTAFVGDAPLIGHNIEFDLAFLNKHGLFADRLAIDTYEIASVMMPAAPRYNLNALMQELNIAPEGDYHRALADALATARLYTSLWNRILDLPINLVREIVAMSGTLHWRGAASFADALEVPRSTEPDSRADYIADFDPTSVFSRPASLESQAVLKADPAAQLPTPEGLVGTELRDEIRTAFASGEHRLIEAGADTINPLAYLYPAAEHAIHTGNRVILAAGEDKQRTWESEYLPRIEGVESARLDSRSHYLCLSRLRMTRQRRPTSIEELRVLAKVLIWIYTMRGTPRAEDAGAISLRGPAEQSAWRRLSAQDEDCTPHRCAEQHGGACPFFKAHANAQSAHLVLVDHGFLLSDALKADTGGVIPPYNYAIIDDLHELEGAGTWSLRTRYELTEIRQQFANLGSTKSGLLGSILANARESLEPDKFANLKTFVQQISAFLREMDTRIDALFKAMLAFLDSAGLLRADEYILFIRLTNDLRHKQAFGSVAGTWDTLREYTEGIADLLLKLRSALARAAFKDKDDFLPALEAAARYLTTLHKTLAATITEPDSNTVYWCEISKDAGRISFHSAPINVGDRIGKHLWDARRSVIGLGASVRVGGDFEFMRGRLGARRERVPALAMHSATDYTDRILVYLPTDMPEPNERDKYQRGIEKGIIELASVTPGRMLVLFTSFTQLRQASQNVVARLGLGNIAVFDQSDGTSQSALIEGLMSVERGVLLGSRQFWDEVELPPGSLDALVIVRLPFAVPSDPLFASRSEQYSNSFNGYTLPDSLITFRQAFEQILRGASRHNRRGVVALFDKRMTSKEYGQAFLDSLPPSKIQRGLLTELSTTARSWYGSK